MIKVIYTDEINVRRNVEKTVFFNPSNFEGRNGQSSGASIWVWIILVLILVGLFFWWRARKKRKERQRMKHHHEMK